MKKIAKIITLLMASIMIFGAAACGGGGKNSSSTSGSGSSGITDELQTAVNAKLSALSPEDFTKAQLIGTDALGRSVLPTVGFENKYVGIFYFVLMGESGHNSILDITEMLKENGTGMDNPLFDKTKNLSNFHYWGEPLYGYYQSQDKWVIRRHLELFMEAGIDFLYIDYSNGKTYPRAVNALLSVITELQEAGYKNVPTVTFICPNAEKDDNATQQMGSLNTLAYLWETYYSKPQYDNCWFRADKEMNPYENPLVVGRFENVSDNNMLDFLWLKELQWPLNANNSDYFPWIEWNTPDKSQPNHNGIMNVSVAQHVSSWSSTSFTDSLKVDKGEGEKAYKYRARGFDPSEPNKYGTDPQKVLAGSNFEWQWQNALKAKDDLKMVTITGWNEWVAPKVDYGRSYAVFNDAFNYEFSRDAEMMKGGYGDNYYMQIARNIRDFSGIRIDGTDNIARYEKCSPVTAATVESLKAHFVDMEGDALERTATAVDTSISYSDKSNRNDITDMYVGNDGENLYIAMKTKELQAYNGTDSNWMNVYISTLGNGWAGYDFIINRKPNIAEGKTSVERFKGSTADKINDAGECDITVSGKTVLFKIPLKVLGVTGGQAISLKGTDNIQKFGDTDDFYISGDSAPLGRLNYAYKIA